jgi:glycosyltransferase involved in cell wall biosynthesis
MSYGREEYRELVQRFGELVRNAVPKQATVIVVSKGDHELLDLDIDQTWHFPQRSDGTYAGYYPLDSASAIDHLEALRKKGGEYLAFPAPSLWWLDHYEQFRQHLDTRYRPVIEDQAAGVIYALNGSETNGRTEIEGLREKAVMAAVKRGEAARSTVVERPSKPVSPNGKSSALEMLFSIDYYAEQAGRAFASLDEALSHYEEIGQHEGANPHPLFDTRWYLARNPPVHASGCNPLMHFIEHAVAEGLDPNPYFDTEFYYAQIPRIREAGVNALVHYVDPASRAAHPNPLFRDGFYLNKYRDARDWASTPLEHFLRYGRAEGRTMSHIHDKLLAGVRSDASGLHRGQWTTGTVLLFTQGSATGRWPSAHALADRLAAEHRLGSLIVSYVGSPSDLEFSASRRSFVLEDFALACKIFRPAALRLLALALTAPRPLFAICDVPDVLETLAGNGVGCYFLFPDDARSLTDTEMDAIVQHSRRILLSSKAKARSKTLSKRSKQPLGDVSVCAPAKAGPTPEGYADALVKLARKDFNVPTTRPARRGRAEKPRIVIPCSDWSVSGVNASMESIGLQLIELGWDIEVIFTRDEATVLESTHDTALPALPYRYLERHRKGPLGMWGALMADLESRTPSILFMAYDFLGNSVAPALTERVGIVTWVQADDRDYYEQVYRLGRYCNAVVCVSKVIRDRVVELNPAIGERAHVIHNSSVRQDDIARRRGPRANRMRLVYTGRLVQYQKRVLDYIDLARALDHTGVPYEITLIGTFSPRENAQETFEMLAAPQIEDGRIKLAGRMTRTDIMQALTRQDFFVLLSDFEGLPLSLVEAMARGCVPVVAESPSGIPEIVTSGENGYIVSGRDYDAWAALLAGLWEDRQALSETSRRARLSVRDQFTVERVGAQFDELFRRVASEIGSGNYRRPRSLNWGGDRSHAGDVLPPPNLFRPATLQIPGLQ